MFRVTLGLAFLAGACAGAPVPEPGDGSLSALIQASAPRSLEDPVGFSTYSLSGEEVDHSDILRALLELEVPEAAALGILGAEASIAPDKSLLEASPAVARGLAGQLDHARTLEPPAYSPARLLGREP